MDSLITTKFDKDKLKFIKPNDNKIILKVST